MTYKPSENPLTLNKIALWILLFFGVFDTARLFTPLPSSFGYLKEICIFFLFIQIIIKKIDFEKRSLFGSCFVLLLFISVISLFRALFFSDFFSTELLIYQIKNLEFFLLFLIFTNLHKLAPSVSIENLVKWYVSMALILVIVNFIGVLVPNPVCYKFIGRGFDSSMYSGRFSLGQPAMASFPVLLTFIVFWMKNQYSKRDYFIMLICLTYIVLSTAMTAYVILMALILFKVYVDRKKIKNAKYNICFFLAIILLTLVWYYFLFDFLAIDHSMFDFEFMRARFLKMLGMGNYIDMSRQIRNDFRNLILAEILNRNSLIWGIGPDYYLTVKNNFYAKIPIENTYIDFFAKSGVIGLASYIVFIWGGIKGLARNSFMHIKDNKFLLIIGIFVAVILYSWTLPIFSTYCMACGFALFLAFIYISRGENV